MNDLSPAHLAMLRASAISDDVIRARGYRTVTDSNELHALGFAPAQCRVPGLLLPLWTTDGGNSLYVYRPDSPRVIEDKRTKLPDGTHPCKAIKYEQPKGAGVRLDCPPVCLPMLSDPSIPLWVTEGQKKADSLASHGLCAIALLGVWNFVGRNSRGGVTFLADWDYISLKDRAVHIVFDSDVMTKREVRQALDRLTEHLQRKGGRVDCVYLPAEPGKGKVGVDDYLAAGHSVTDLESLIEAPRPALQAAPPTAELLDDAPPRMTRPLALIDGRAYAAAWLPVRLTRRESLDRSGEIVHHDPPIVTNEIRLFIVRHDGAAFGDVGAIPLSDLGLDIHLPEIPPADRTWSSRGVKSFTAGERPDPADVFRRVASVVDRFIDFDRSLTDQHTMAEMIACYILATWLLDAFDVIGFLWPNGERGSGKTHLLFVIAELAYLGQVILSGGSFAALRDLADYGATLAFDDAEGLGDPKRTDPDKRALLLAGNRRGVAVPLKEQTGDKTWRTRYVNAFTPRLFSAIRLPDPILASRTIVIPLIRTIDRQRANSDPLDYSAWPYDRRVLIDDLWALALSALPALPEYDARVGQNARLSGRALQPWRAILAVAAWLDEHGVPGLWERMESLSVSYQAERPDLETSDLTALVIRALIECAARDISDVSAMSDINVEGVRRFIVPTTAITAEAVKIAERDELDIDVDHITSRRVGRVLGKMRLDKGREAGKGTRGWVYSINDLKRFALSYGLPLPDKLGKIETNSHLDTLPVNVTNGGDVTNVTRLDLLEGTL